MPPFTEFNQNIDLNLALLELSIAAAVGLAIGIERELSHKAASVRTFSFICTGSCLFTILSIAAATSEIGDFDPTRISANILTGIGFIGGGVIFKTANKVEGISTAAMIWITAAIGMAIGHNLIGLALWVLFLYFVIHIISVALHALLKTRDANALDGLITQVQREVQTNTQDNPK